MDNEDKVIGIDTLRQANVDFAAKMKEVQIKQAELQGRLIEIDRVIKARTAAFSLAVESAGKGVAGVESLLSDAKTIEAYLTEGTKLSEVIASHLDEASATEASLDAEAAK